MMVVRVLLPRDAHSRNDYSTPGRLGIAEGEGVRGWGRGGRGVSRGLRFGGSVLLSLTVLGGICFALVLRGFVGAVAPKQSRRCWV